jgi:hypothetical protein
MYATSSPFLALLSVHRVALFPPQRGQSARASLAAAHHLDKTWDAQNYVTELNKVGTLAEPAP